MHFHWNSFIGTIGLRQSQIHIVLLGVHGLCRIMPNDESWSSLVQENLTLFVLGLLFTGFGAGWGAHEAIFPRVTKNVTNKNV